MKPKSISKTSNFFSDAQMAAALKNAPDMPAFDNKPTANANVDWQEAIVSHSYPELKAQLAKRRMGRPLSDITKEQVAIRFDKSVLDTFRATGKGWQTRMNAVLLKHLDEAGTV